jgi:hypothetical protein
MKLQRRLIVLIGVLGVIAIAAIGIIFTKTSKMNVVNHWVLYASTSAAGPYRVFLDPFPDRNSCMRASNLITTSHGYARCGQRIEVADRESERQLFWEFLSPEAPGVRICAHRNTR